MSIASSSSAPAAAASLARTSSSRSLIAFGGYLAFLVASAVILSTLAVDQVPQSAFLLAMTLLAVCLLPLAIWQAGQRRGAPMFEMVCVAFAAAYAVPVFLIQNGIQNFNQFTYLEWDVTARALGFVVIGVTAMVGGYYLLSRLPLGRWLPRTDLPLHPLRMKQFLWFAFGAAGGLRVVERLTSATWGRGVAAAASSLLTLVLAVGIALLANRVYRADGTARSGSKLLLYGVIAAVAVIGLGGGMLETVFLPLVVVFVVRWHASRRFPVAWLVGGCLAFLLLNAAKYEYRGEVWFSSKQYTLVDQIETWSRTSATVLASLTTADGVNTLLNRTIHRFDLIHTFAHVMDLTPSHLPHYAGVTYDYLLYGWIPRILWPDKPTAQGANVMFALDYGLLLDSQVDTTMIGIGFLAEAYANFGLLGVVVVMFLIGCLFGGAHVMFNGPDSDGGRAAYIAVLAYYLNGMGSATAMFVFFGIQGFIALPLILRFFSGRWRASTPSPQPARVQSDLVPTGPV